jgi:uncharacterized repeat protein (TIGR01451 family)
VRDKVQVRVKDKAGSKAEASAEASVTVKGGPQPTLKIRVEKTASPTEVEEPGGTVTFRVKVRNEGTEAVTLIKIHDNVYGDLVTGSSSLISSGNCPLEEIQPGTTYQCEFRAAVAGEAGDAVMDTVQVRAKDDAGNKTEASDQATVVIKGGSKPTLKIRVEKTASPKQVLEPGQVVTYRIKVRNEGTATVEVTQMQDNPYGNLLDGSNSLLNYTSCKQAKIEPGATYQCEFDAEVTGYAGTKVTDTVGVRVKDPAGNKTEASAQATVKIVSEVPDTGVPLPPPVIAGGLLALGAAAMGAGALVQSRGRKSR